MRWLHIRRRDKQGNLTPKGGMTVAYDLEEGIVFFAVAKCSKKDHYCRKTGRSISQGRFDKGLREGKCEWAKMNEDSAIETILKMVT
jgi:hypothetical protein